MPGSLLAARRAALERMAQGWLASGAESFELSAGGARLERWPAGNGAPADGLSAPLTVRGKPAGAIAVGGVVSPGAAARLAADAAMLSALAESDSDVEALAAELVSSQDQLLAIYALAEALRNPRDLPELMSVVAAQAAELLAVDHTVVWFVADDGAIQSASHPPGSLAPEIVHAYVRAAQASDPGAAPTTSSFGGGAVRLAALRIRLRGQWRAGLGISRRSTTHFTSPELKLARAIADQAGLPMENALLLQERVAQARMQTEMELARQVQMRLLPRDFAPVDGIDYTAAARPASQVGGDFYDALTPPGRGLIFSVGDVSGKGMPAALLMTITRAAITSKGLFVPNATPALILERANQDIYDDLTEVGMFATAFVGEYRPAAREIVFANAGHSPVIYCPAGGAPRLLEADGTALGVLPQTFSLDQCIALGPGDLLVVASDGFCEARNMQDELYGYDRLLALAAESAVLPAAQIAARFFGEIDAFSGAHPQDDDQTLLVIKGTQPCTTPT